MSDVAHAATQPLRVLMITEGTYPFHWGGVSTWCHELIRDLPEVEFSLLSLASGPQVKVQFDLPANVVEFHPIPLWGVREVLETRRDLSFAELRQRLGEATEAVVTAEFVPTFQAFVEEFFADRTEPQRLGRLIHALYRFFRRYDFDATMRSAAVWNCFAETARTHFPAAAARLGYTGATFELWDITRAMQWLYHWLFPLATPLPEADVAHAAMAGICTILAVAAKYEHGAGFLLTEHGIYLRERYLAEAVSADSLFLKLFSLRFARRMSDLSYALADQISPCCDYNQRWELRNGATPDRLQTIYYGVDATVFTPAGKPVGEPPVVVWVGRINPLKDLVTLLRAAALVHQIRPDIQFRLFGSAPAEDAPYYEECLKLRSDLGLDETVVFAGYTARPELAYNQGDVVVLSSISEGFPFCVLEAMLCAKPLVATAVGGVPEQIEGCGIAVEPRNPDQMAVAILDLMNDPERCDALGRAAREKAEQEFSVRQSGDAYKSTYLRLTHRAQPGQAVEERAAAPAAHHGVAALSGGLSPDAGLAEVAPFPERPAVDSTPSGAEAGIAHPLPAGIPTYYAVDGPIPANSQTIVSTLVTVPAAGGQANGAAGNGHGAAGGRRKPRIRPPSGQGEWEPTNPAAVNTLARDITRRVPQLIDSLEVAALLESLGINDEVATQRYGAPDAFALAEAVLARAKENGLPSRVRRPANQAEFTVGRRAALLDYSRGLIALLPCILLLLIIEAYGRFGGWGNGQIMALSLGFTGSMVLTNGFVQAICRRSSIYLGLGNRRAAREFLRLTTLIAGLCIAAVAVLAFALCAALDLFSLEERTVFVVAFVGLSAIWLAAAGLSLVRAQGWLATALGAGLVVGALVDRAVAPYSEAHLAAATVVGFATTLAVLRYALGRALAGGPEARVELPSAAYLFCEAAPYFAYGTACMLFILVSHLLGWFGALEAGENRWHAIGMLEAGMTLSLAPIIVAGGIAEHALRLFWHRALAAQTATPGGERPRFGRTLAEFYQRHLQRYLLCLAAGSVLAYLLFRAALGAELLAGWVDLPQPDTTQFVFRASLIAYYLLGWGLFNCMLVVTLARPGLALRAVAVAVVATLVVGLPLSLGVHFSYATVAFVAGAAAFVAASSWAAARVLRSADYYYAASF